MVPAPAQYGAGNCGGGNRIRHGVRSRRSAPRRSRISDGARPISHSPSPSTVVLLGCAWIVERPPVHVTPIASGKPPRALSAVRVRLSCSVNSCLSSMVIFVPFVYLPSFAHDHGANEIRQRCAVSIIGGASVSGRIGLGAIADRPARSVCTRRAICCWPQLRIWLFGSHIRPWSCSRS